MWKILFMISLLLMGYNYLTIGVNIPTQGVYTAPPVIRNFINNDVPKISSKIIDLMRDLIYIIKNGSDNLKEKLKVDTSNIPAVDKEKPQKNIRYMVRRSNS